MRIRELPCVAIVVVAVLSGCVGQPPVEPPGVTPTVSPMFASDEEALAAAVAAYERYLAVSDQILIDGGANPERIEAVATGEFAALLLESFAQMKELGWTSSGGTVMRDSSLQSFENGESVSIYVCEDVSSVEVIDSTGASVVSETRPPSAPFLYVLSDIDGVLKVSDREVWSSERC